MLSRRMCKQKAHLLAGRAPASPLQPCGGAGNAEIGKPDHGADHCMTVVNCTPDWIGGYEGETLIASF